MPTFLFLNCSGQVSETKEFKVGVFHTELSPHHYRIVSTGKASQQSIEDDDSFKKKFSACQAAKEMYLKKIKTLEPAQTYRDFFIEVHSNRISEDNIYCEYTIDYKVPKEEKK